MYSAAPGPNPALTILVGLKLVYLAITFQMSTIPQTYRSRPNEREPAKTSLYRLLPTLHVFFAKYNVASSSLFIIAV